jgi:TIR domain-containing protein
VTSKPKRVLVVGSARFWEAAASRRARRLGSDLAELGFALTTGAEPGVDKAVAEGYCTQARRQGADLRLHFTQLKEPFRFRSWLNVSSGFNGGDCVLRVSRGAWVQTAVDTCDAAVMIGGRIGALHIAERFLDAGKPVFPVPFVPGRSDLVFQDIIEHWLDRPVPGLTRNQFLRLSLPWTGGTEPLTDLLLGAVTDTPDIFISYRRADAGWAAGRIQAELADAFGERRVFSDITTIRGGDVWRTSIEAALEHAKVGIVLAGNQWLVSNPTTQKPRLFDPDDTVRAEVRALADGRRTVIVLLVDRPPLNVSDLPEDLDHLTELQGISVSQENWRSTLPKVLIEVRAALRLAARPMTSQAR